MAELDGSGQQGTLYGIGIGPGDPELLTLKAARILRASRCIYLPTSRLSRQNYVRELVEEYATDDCEICPVGFSLAASRAERTAHWQQTAGAIAARLTAGQDVTFVTLGDAMLYSTWIYLVRALQQQLPTARIETVPGISSFSLTAALTRMPLGEGLQALQVIPAAGEEEQIEAAVTAGSCVVIMKIGRRLPGLIDLLERLGALERSVFVARAGLPEQRIETDLRCLRTADEQGGNLAVVIVGAKAESETVEGEI